MSLQVHFPAGELDTGELGLMKMNLTPGSRDPRLPNFGSDREILRRVPSIFIDGTAFFIKVDGPSLSAKGHPIGKPQSLRARAFTSLLRIPRKRNTRGI
jgi:hypothetical protein